MTCRCGNVFCFMCLADWSTHGSKTGGWYECNKYESEKNKTGSKIYKMEKQVKNAKHELEKFAFYAER